jgi:NADPH-dependent 2,4-dienoyl-CoA reductase/sulfur reductase-like enzyme
VKRYKYLIVGGGMAADAAVRGIREEDADGSIGVLTLETDPPYQRPPLSKDLWTEDMPVAETDCGTASLGADVFTNSAVQSVNPEEKTVCGRSASYAYEKLLLATGGTPNTLPFPQSDRAIYYRTLDDYRVVKKITQSAGEITIIGGSFIGCEMAAALLANHCNVTVIFPEQAPFRQIFPKVVSMDLLELFEQQGATMIPGIKLSDLNCDSDQCRLVLEDGRQLTTSAAVIGIGIKPNMELAESAGLKTGDGIEVNRQLQTSNPDIYAAGDVCCFYSPALNRMLRVEHEDHALQSGKIAGRNMAGQTISYDHLPFFYSSLFGQGCEAVGVLDSSLQTEGIWNGVYEPGIWAYLENRRVCGVLMWNLSGKTDLARALICEPDPLSAEELMLRLGTFLSENSE